MTQRLRADGVAPVLHHQPSPVIKLAGSDGHNEAARVPFMSNVHAQAPKHTSDHQYDAICSNTPAFS